MFVIEEANQFQTAYPGYPALLAIANDRAYPQLPVGLFPVGFIPEENASLSLSQYAGSVSGGSATFTVGATVGNILEVVHDNQSFTLAVNPTSPQPKEFTFNTSTGVVQVYGTFAANPRFLVLSLSSAIAVSPFYTSLAQLPDIFQRYELIGEVQFNTSFEGHPSAQFEVICSWAEAEALKVELQPGKRKTLTLFGIGFEVQDLSISKRSLLKDPSKTAVVSVSLTGMWETYLDQRVILDAPQDAVTEGARTIRGDTTVQAIAQKVGARVVLPPNTIYAPRQANQEQTISLGEAFTGHLRMHGLFAVYCNPAEISNREWDSTPIHNIMYSDLVSEELEISVQAYPRSLDYENSPLDWGNALGDKTATGEDTAADQQNAPPQWRLKPPKRERVTTGSATLNQPIGAVEAKSVLSLNFDSGGPIREQRTVTTEAGVPISQTTERWGFAGTSHQHVYVYNLVRKVWEVGNFASLPWRQIEKTSTTYSYDEKGYLSEINTTGWRLARLRSESSNEGCQAYSAWLNASDAFRTDADGRTLPSAKTVKFKLLKTYEFQSIPVLEKTQYQTALLRSHYNDIPSRPTEDYTYEEPKFLPDGRINNPYATGSDTSIEEFSKNGAPYYRIKTKVPVPGWADPRYSLAELVVKSAYLSMPNPESTEKQPLPDFQTGELKEVEERIFVPDYRDRPRPSSQSIPGVVVTSTVEEAETFIVSSKLTNQLESSFARSAKDNTQTQNKGRPSEHTRKVPQYEKIDPRTETDPRDNKDPNKEDFEYRVTTRSPSDPLYQGDTRLVGESISFPYAASFEQAMKALETELAIANTSGTETLSIVVLPTVGMGIRDGDRVNLEDHGIWRVLSTAKKIEVVAPGICRLGDVQFQLGREIAVPVIQTQKLPLKTQGETVEQDTSNLDGSGRPIIEPSQLLQGRSLANPNGI